VNDIYNGVSIQQAISDTINYARARNQRIVFQGGIQGEYWLNSGGTLEQLEHLIQDNADIAIFAFAAGNGGPDGNFKDPNYLTSVNGVGQLETTHNNVMSVGALQYTGTATVNGLTNASSVDIASYSNRGSNLTLMAATDSPAMDKLGNMNFFGGTSCANPNMAGIASLVWSVNSSLTGGQLRQVLIDTAMDLGTPGRDNTFGNGLVNADAAVRRAWALQRSSDLANLYSGKSLFV
jgi:subtilisin family serine protease